MLDHGRQSSRKTFILLTECGLTGILQSEFTDKKFVGPCTMCKYMKSNSLDNIVRALEDPRPQNVIEIPADVLQKARRTIDRLFEFVE